MRITLIFDEMATHRKIYREMYLNVMTSLTLDLLQDICVLKKIISRNKLSG